MPITLSTKIQNTVPDSIVYAEDLQIAVRANGEQRVSFIDLAGNIYNAEIPQPVNAPTFTGLTVSAVGITPVGFYGYKYLYAATSRYPLVNGGKAIGGSIAPRGNPSPSTVVNMNVNLNFVNLTLSVCDRKDISELWVFRTLNYPTSADALIAVNAGLCFYVGKVANAPGAGTVAFQDTAPTISLDQIEFDNFSAPTFKYVTYIPPYFWGIGNDQLIIAVSWVGKIVTITDANLQWFDGRNGQLTTINGIITGGIDARGTFLFKAGDEGGFNQQTNCVLTKDGITAETLVPASGTGYILIQGNGSVLYRSKYKNPFSWGVTQTFGANRQATPYAISVSTGNATAIAGLPEDQQLKIDFKNPAACYTYNLRLAGSPEFETTRKLISNYSISAHASQFIASFKGHRVLWGWDADTFAILQCDGNAQYPISDSIFKTLRDGVRDPYRIQFAHGICDDENELNCMWIPYSGQDNFLNSYAGDPYYNKVPLTDMLIYQHYPSGKWGFVNDVDLTSATKVRNLYLNKPQIIGGTERGLLYRLNDKNNPGEGGTFYTPITFNVDTEPPTWIDFPIGTFSALPNYADLQVTLPGQWGVLCNFAVGIPFYIRIVSLVGDSLYIDMALNGDFGTGIYTCEFNDLSSFGGGITDCRFKFGSRTVTFKKKFDLAKPAQLKRITDLYLKGSGTLNLLAYIANTSTESRSPLSYTDSVAFSAMIRAVEKIALPAYPLIDVQFVDFRGTPMSLKGMGIKTT